MQTLLQVPLKPCTVISWHTTDGILERTFLINSLIRAILSRFSVCVARLVVTLVKAHCDDLSQGASICVLAAYVRLQVLVPLGAVVAERAFDQVTDVSVFAFDVRLHVFAPFGLVVAMRTFVDLVVVIVFATDMHL